MLMTSWSCADHLGGMAAVLRTRRGVASLYMLARGAAEAAVVACYQSEVGISPLERVRRNMNCNLDALCQDLNMLRRFGDPAPGSGLHGTRPRSKLSGATGKSTVSRSSRKAGAGRPTWVTSRRAR